MFWIYIPPVILVAALAALAVMLGRKSADLKKIKNFHPQSGMTAGKADSSGFEPSGRRAGETGWKNRLNLIGQKSLHLLEKLLYFVKHIFTKTEQSASIWAAKLRARRNGKKIEKIFPEELSKDSDQEGIIREIEKTEEISANFGEVGGSVKYAGSEIVVRRKIADEPAVMPKKEPLPEDKIREAALIYRIAENPKDIEAYREIGDYYMGIGNIKDAKEAFKMVLKLRPRDLKAKSSLREIEMKMRLGN